MKVLLNHYSDIGFKKIHTVYQIYFESFDIKKKFIKVNINTHIEHLGELYKTGELDYETIIDGVYLGRLNMFDNITKGKKTIITIVDDPSKEYILKSSDVECKIEKNTVTILEPNEINKIDSDAYAFVMNINPEYQNKRDKTLI